MRKRQSMVRGDTTYYHDIRHGPRPVRKPPLSLARTTVPIKRGRPRIHAIDGDGTPLCPTVRAENLTPDDDAKQPTCPACLPAWKHAKGLAES
jgi:hypothetical protein